ncbi:helix-turn-helix transcriptional regulator [Fodinicurvata sp. EGI_FJ10296]|uniref:helix-turn-helix domain-containing protein n=1 Tax=Fodinicurvata sp. EGI_FJ10296 TaxID=3231908 RepID=UPI0034556D6C
MPSQPPFALPAFIAVLLLTAVIIARRGRGKRWFGLFTPITIMLAVSAILIVIGGLRWRYDGALLGIAQTLLAASMPPLVWRVFTRLTEPGTRAVARPWLHSLPPLTVAAMLVIHPIWPLPIDAAIGIIFLGYGVQLVRLVAPGADTLVCSRLEATATSRLSFLIAGLAMAGSGVVDIAIAIDFAVAEGRHARLIVGYAHFVVLGCLAVAAALMEEPAPRPAETPDDRPQSGDAGEDDAVILAFDTLMTDLQLYRDPDLTLDRIARRLKIPARRISGAVNRRGNRNVSQLVNGFRIDRAARQLRETDMSVTEIMFDCGFQTKSNFNREFRRTFGQSPTEFRSKAAPETQPGLPYSKPGASERKSASNPPTMR